MVSTMLILPKHRTVMYKKTLTVSECCLWNSLPFSLKDVDLSLLGMCDGRNFYMYDL